MSGAERLRAAASVLREVGLEWSLYGGLDNPPDDRHNTITIASGVGANGQGAL